MIAGQAIGVGPKCHSLRFLRLKMSTEDVQFRVIESKDYGRVLDFLRINFYREEPITIGSEGIQSTFDEEFTMSQIEHDTCLMAVEQSDNKEAIIGVVMAGPKDANEAEILFEKAAEAGSTKWGQILRILACMERDANVFERYDVSKALHIHASSVNANQRGRSISARLKRELMVVGRNLGYPLMTADSSSFYSGRTNEQLGMDCVYSLRYDEYLDKEGKPIFTPPTPHEFVKTYAIRL